MEIKRVRSLPLSRASSDVTGLAAIESNLSAPEEADTSTASEPIRTASGVASQWSAAKKAPKAILQKHVGNSGAH